MNSGITPFKHVIINGPSFHDRREVAGLPEALIRQPLKPVQLTTRLPHLHLQCGQINLTLRANNSMRFLIEAQICRMPKA